MTDRKISDISIIIPTLHEENSLELQLAALQPFPDAEIIVADGGSAGTIRAAADLYGATLVSSPAGRGCQLNCGASLATRKILLFLHCDTSLPPDYADHVHAVLGLPRTAAGAFRLAIEGRGSGFRLIEWGANIRSRFLQLPYGDQAFFMTRENFSLAGGFPDQPVMEDLDLIRRLRPLGRIRLARAAVRTSARRWERLGLVRTTLINQVMLAGYMLGINRKTLYGLYYRMR